MFMLRYFVVLLFVFSLSACGSTIKKLQRLGEEPKLEKLEIPNKKPGYKPLELPKEMLTKECDAVSPNSLWRAGNRAFFKDRKARNIGDIIKIHINIDDSAILDNKTTRQRKGNDNISMPKLFGLQSKIFNSGQTDFGILGVKSSSDHLGEGKIDRTETISTEIASMVTQILPNGNMVISGSQEIRVNFEVRQIAVQGIVRPEDVSIDNTVDSDKIAELRVVYGGVGDMTDLQQPRMGSQLLDIISPF